MQDCFHNPHLLLLHELGHLLWGQEVADMVRDGRIIVRLLPVLVPSDPCCSLNLGLAQLVLPGSLKVCSNGLTWFEMAIHLSDELKANLHRQECL